MEDKFWKTGKLVFYYDRVLYKNSSNTEDVREKEISIIDP